MLETTQGIPLAWDIQHLSWLWCDSKLCSVAVWLCASVSSLVNQQ